MGTWERRNFDGSEYFILGPDHSYAFIGDVSDSNVPRLMLGCSGTWRIEGEDLILDCVMAQPSDSAKDRPPQKHSEREKVADFLKYYLPHTPVTYEKMP